VNPNLPLPVPNADSRAYWDAAREERLIIRQCKACGTTHFLPRCLCPHCWSEDLEWVQASGRGMVHSYTVIRRAPTPAFADLVPYVVALVDLEEGPRMMANVIGGDALQTRVGDSVRAVFESRGADGARIVQFTRVEGGAA